MVLTYGIPPHTVLLVKLPLLQQNHVLQENLMDHSLLLHVVLLTDAVVAEHVCVVLKVF